MRTLQPLLISTKSLNLKESEQVQDSVLVCCFVRPENSLEAGPLLKQQKEVTIYIESMWLDL